MKNKRKDSQYRKDFAHETALDLREKFPWLKSHPLETVIEMVLWKWARLEEEEKKGSGK